MPKPIAILLVEDSPPDADLIMHELRQAGIQFTWQRVDTEPRYLEALEGEIDLVLSDYNLPSFNGLRALELLKQSGKEIPFIIISGTIGEDTAVAAMKLGATDFLLKDRLGRLGPAVNQALAAGRARRERRETEAAMRESEEKFRQVVENIREVFWLTDASQNTILYISPAYEAIWGRSCESLYANSSAWAESIHPEDRARVALAAATQQRKGSYDESYRIIRPDGTVRWVRARAFPVFDASGAVHRIAGTAEDVTEYRSLQEQFRQAQKMDAMGMLAGGIAHDFNNILGAIGGYTELAKLEAEGNACLAGYLEAVHQAARRAGALVRQILAFSRRQAQQREVLQLSEVVKEALKLLRATIPATIEFDVSLGAELPSVFADPTQIHQIVMNLGTNAAHAMGDRQGRLTVRLESRMVDEVPGEGKSPLRAGRYVVLSVGDTGWGMDESTLSRIFEPFFTTKPPGEGTGLGLAAVHGIMQSHEGMVSVTSRPGEGTVFHLFFPAHGGKAVVAVPAGLAVPRGNGERILFVDDEAALADLGQRMLAALGYAPEAYTEPAKVLAAVRAEPDGYDLVITDHMMPGIIGTDLAQNLAALSPALPIILTTGYSTELTPERLHRLGVARLLPKPISIEALACAVHGALAGRPGRARR